MDEELRTRLDALEVAMRAVTSTLIEVGGVAFSMSWEKVTAEFLRDLPDDQMHRTRALRDAIRDLQGPHVPWR